MHVDHAALHRPEVVRQVFGERLYRLDRYGQWCRSAISVETLNKVLPSSRDVGSPRPLGSPPAGRVRCVADFTATRTMRGGSPQPAAIFFEQDDIRCHVQTARRGECHRERSISAVGKRPHKQHGLLGVRRQGQTVAQREDADRSSILTGFLRKRPSSRPQPSTASWAKVTGRL